MEKTFQQKIRKVILILSSGFIILFLFRLGYGFTIQVDQHNSQNQFFDRLSSIKKNYASNRFKVESSNSTSPILTVDQKYEKIADINTKSNQFIEDEKEARKNIKNLKGLIQFEQKNGNVGSRNLHLIIGVPPINFDSLYHKLIQIGKIEIKQITKKDKTNEYRELNAKKASLEQIRNSLIDLKTKGGKIEEFVQLENRILEIEQQLQELGVSLGDFDEENEFCTVKFSLTEGKKIKISLIHRIKVALEWTIEYYLKLMVGLIIIILIAYFLINIFIKVRKIDESVEKKN